MKKIVLLAVLLSLTTGSYASEKSQLEPLHTVLSKEYKPGAVSSYVQEEKTSSQVKDGVYEATFTPAGDENMVPQNDAAEGKPVAEKPLPKVRVETKQGRRTNAQWNPGGKGTKSFF